MLVKLSGHELGVVMYVFEPEPEGCQSVITLLAISGSLRRASTNTALLRAAAMIAPVHVTIQLYEGLGTLPHFNPDLDTGLNAATLPGVVHDLRSQVVAADGLLIACPEYAHGLPGAFKNALDWLVGGPEFIAKPVAILRTSPRSVHAPAQLEEIVTTMSGHVVAEASRLIAVRGRNITPQEITENGELASQLREVLDAYVRALSASRVGDDFN